ncbi:MAG: phasin family protein [Pseudomonadales bacterium]|nr:phasin family protein [Pseudomonadales bacterium]MDP6470124.1 phasin family protein [Pseudomonadales bacterium]
MKSNQIIQSDKEEPEMSIIEKQVQLGRELFEINAATVRRLVELQSEGVKQYFETNQDFAKRLPEVKDVSSFVELQREYGKTVWSNTQEGWQSGGEVVREAVENAGAAVRSAFNAEEPAAETA